MLIEMSVRQANMLKDALLLFSFEEEKTVAHYEKMISKAKKEGKNTEVHEMRLKNHEDNINIADELYDEINEMLLKNK